jgi:branched-chain amino acid transport system permease protein
MIGLPDILRLHTYPFASAALVAGVLAAALAFIVGIPIMRLSGIAAGIATLCVLAIVNVAYSNWDDVTLGTFSMVGIPKYVTVWHALGWACIAMLVAFLYQSSRPGILLRAASQDEVAARAAGVNIPRQRLLAWCIGAFFMAIGGVLYAHFVGVISVNYFYLNMTFITLAMLIVGGRKSLAGAVIGTIVLTSMTELFRQFEVGFSIGTMKLAIPEGSEEVVVAALMIVILILRPDGLTGGREIGWPGRKKLTHSIR